MSEFTTVNSRIIHRCGNYLVLRQVKRRLFVAVPEESITSIYPAPRLVKFVGDFVMETFSPTLQIKTLEPARPLPDYGNSAIATAYPQS